MPMFRFFAVLSLALVLCGAQVNAQPFQPHEPLDPSQAQSLPLTPLDIASGDKIHHFKVEVAKTEHQQHVGLMHRTTLAAHQGMLFPYEQPEILKFWMRNTFIPLDMLFMKADGTITYILENMQPHDETPVGPPGPMSAQLELPAGTVAHLGLKVGDVVHHKVFHNGP